MKFCSIKKSEFRKRHSENRFICDQFILFSVKNEYTYPRYGIIITKKSGNAVVRNRIRRWVKNSLYSNIEECNLSGYDFILIVNKNYTFDRANFHLINKQINNALTQINK